MTVAFTIFLIVCAIAIARWASPTVEPVDLTIPPPNSIPSDPNLIQDIQLPIQQYHRPKFIRPIGGLSGNVEGIDCSSDGARLWFATKSGKIHVFDGESTFKWKFDAAPGRIKSARGVAVDTNGEAFIADHGADCVVVCSVAGGAYMRQFGSHGTGPKQFIQPHGIAVDGKGLVFVTDKTHRVQVFQRDGTFVTFWGSEGNGDGQFKEPKGIAVSSTGEVVVTDLNHRIQVVHVSAFVSSLTFGLLQVFDKSGVFRRKFGRFGNGPGEFSNPFDVAINFYDMYFIADCSNNRVQVFTWNGTFVNSFDGSGGPGEGRRFQHPYSIHIDGKDRLLVGDETNRGVAEVQLYDLSENE